MVYRTSGVDTHVAVSFGSLFEKSFDLTDDLGAVLPL